MIRTLFNAGVFLGATLLLSYSAEACNAGCKAPEPVIEPGKRAGPVSKASTEADLKVLPPKGQVKRVLVHIEESFYKCGTVLFPGTDNQAFVTWATMEKDYDGDDPKNVAECQNLPTPSKPETVRIEKDFFKKPNQTSSWRASNGIRIGMLLRELEQAAGKPIEFSVCRCDYGGVVFTGWPGEDPFGGFLDLWLHKPGIPKHIEEKFASKDAYHALKSSDVPANVADKIVIRRIIVHLMDRSRSEEL